MHGGEVGNAMGVNTWAAFAGSDDKAVVDDRRRTSRADFARRWTTRPCASGRGDGPGSVP
jgi:hypothetical protein